MTAVPRPFTPDLPPGDAIRRADESDTSAVAQVYAAAYPPDTDYPLVEVWAVRSTLPHDATMAAFVAETTDRVVGIAAIEYDSFDEGTAQVCKLAVDPDHQGQGLGRELLKHRVTVLRTDPTFDGLIYSAAVTAHPRPNTT